MNPDLQIRVREFVWIVIEESNLVNLQIRIRESNPYKKLQFV